MNTLVLCLVLSQYPDIYGHNLDPGYTVIPNNIRVPYVYSYRYYIYPQRSAYSRSRYEHRRELIRQQNELKLKRFGGIP